MLGSILRWVVVASLAVAGCAGPVAVPEESTPSAVTTPRAVAAPAPAPVSRTTGGSSAAVREPFDPVGYTHTAEGITRVVEHAAKRERARLEENRERLGRSEETALAGAISPHDDYVYAQQVYVHVYPYIHARNVVLIGVAHHARDFPACENKLIFESYDSWHGPYGNVPISPLRAELIDRLSPGDVHMSNEIHAGEHSLEGLIPFLQHYDREARIVPILVPYMSWERLVELADHVAAASSAIMAEHGWQLGTDVAFLISSDSVHYGDQGWGNKSFADFGANGEAYDRAVARDLSLVGGHLTGKITDKGLEGFYNRVLAADYHEYRIPWCGRFSVPFGLATLRRLSDQQGRSSLQGILLRYGTTLDPGRTDPGVEGLGVTAPANLHHWVGFAAIAYP